MQQLKDAIENQNLTAQIKLKELNEQYPESDWQVYPPHISSIYSMFNNDYAIFKNGRRVNTVNTNSLEEIQ